MLYLICAAVGGTLLVCQFGLTLLGLGGDDDGHDAGDHHDFGHDAHAAGHHHDGHAHGHTSSWYVGVLTFRTLVAALTFFGLAGMAGRNSGWDDGLTLAVALAAGSGAMFLVAWLMRSLHRLNADGSVRFDRAVGQTGTVYLKVPGGKAGVGKVLLNLQNRTVECEAVTPHGDLPTGSKVVVVGVVGTNTVEVVPATETERVSHV